MLTWKANLNKLLCIFIIKRINLHKLWGGLKILQSIKDYLKYDNNYWNKARIKELKKRLLVYSLLSIIAFEGYAIATKQYPWQAACFLGQKVGYGTQEILTDFPMRSLAYMKGAASQSQRRITSELLWRFVDCQGLPLKSGGPG